MHLGSVATGVRESDVTSFPAVRAIVKAVHTKTNFFEALADSAVFFASALVLGLVALDAEDGAGRHRCLLKRLYLRVQVCGKTGVCNGDRRLQPRSKVFGEVAASGRFLTRIGAHASIVFLPRKAEWNSPQLHQPI